MPSCIGAVRTAFSDTIISSTRSTAENYRHQPLLLLCIERLIGTFRRAYLDRVTFWNAVDLARKLGEFMDHYNEHRVHRSLDGTTPRQRADAPSPAPTALDHHILRQHCRGLFQTPIAA
jgi:hypothetical protein